MVTGATHESHVTFPVSAGIREETAFGEAHPRDVGKIAFSGMRILFGAIFVFDGMLKWYLFSTGQMQGVIDSTNAYGISWISTNWALLGALVGLGETAGGLLLVIGLFQRPAALVSATIMFLIWGVGGFGGMGLPGFWSSGPTDPGGDLMLALVFVGLMFVPYAHGIASHFRLRERWMGASLVHRLLRWIVA